jgi:prevent-host-death family protein
MQYNVHAAKTNLSKLIEAALNGEEVVIARDSRPVVKIVPVETRSGFKFGILAGIVKDVPDFFAPMSEEDLRLWEGGGNDDRDPA